MVIALGTLLSWLKEVNCCATCWREGLFQAWMKWQAAESEQGRKKYKLLSNGNGQKDFKINPPICNTEIIFWKQLFAELIEEIFIDLFKLNKQEIGFSYCSSSISLWHKVQGALRLVAECFWMPVCTLCNCTVNINLFVHFLPGPNSVFKCFHSFGTSDVHKL